MPHYLLLQIILTLLKPGVEADSKARSDLPAPGSMDLPALIEATPALKAAPGVAEARVISLFEEWSVPADTLVVVLLPKSVHVGDSSPIDVEAPTGDLELTGMKAHLPDGPAGRIAVLATAHDARTILFLKTVYTLSLAGYTDIRFIGLGPVGRWDGPNQDRADLPESLTGKLTVYASTDGRLTIKEKGRAAPHRVFASTDGRPNLVALHNWLTAVRPVADPDEHGLTIAAGSTLPAAAVLALVDTVACQRSGSPFRTWDALWNARVLPPVFEGTHCLTLFPKIAFAFATD